ncbi:MAG: methionyl-tRNA formyltransferase [Planctomycetota bacterium]|nr:methionyl-tRNA formyltransferase [Planctomycetota bacterium]MDA1251394.1 methionyl-tRNA formyltransferase [Planctomycetota bacterium]
MEIVVAGAVSSTRRTLEALIRHGADVVGVLQMSAERAHTVTGFEPLDAIAGRAGIPCATFQNINDDEIVAQAREWQPDLLFVVGLSQLVRDEMLAVPKMGCIGFHPTFLPAGRGRAPLAWLTLDNGPGAASFFLIDEGMDSGPIFEQEPFPITPSDYASDVSRCMDAAIITALDRWLPRLLAGEWDPKPQDEFLATYNCKRGPEDGLIDWHSSAVEIHALIRAASAPHPGAYCWHDDRKLIVWRAELETRLPWRGVPGRVLQVDLNRGALVQTGDGLIWLSSLQFADEPAEVPPGKAVRVGQKLCLTVQDELTALRKRVADLESHLRNTDGK